MLHFSLKHSFADLMHLKLDRVRLSENRGKVTTLPAYQKTVLGIESCEDLQLRIREKIIIK